MIKAVIFDMDGTLLDSLEDIADSANAALAGLGYPVHPVEDYKHFVGDGMSALMGRVLPESAMSGLSQAVAAMMREYAGRWKVKSRPYPGVPELLDELVRLGVPLAVLSNKPDEFTKTIVGDIFARWPFAAAVGEGPGVIKKPDPSGARFIVREMGLEPAQFLLVGDTPMDVQTALAAGMNPVGVAWGFRPEADLKAAGAKVIIKRPEDLIELTR